MNFLTKSAVENLNKIVAKLLKIEDKKGRTGSAAANRGSAPLNKFTYSHIQVFEQDDSFNEKYLNSERNFKTETIPLPVHFTFTGRLEYLTNFAFAGCDDPRAVGTCGW